MDFQLGKSRNLFTFNVINRGNKIGEAGNKQRLWLFEPDANMLTCGRVANSQNICVSVINNPKLASLSATVS